MKKATGRFKKKGDQAKCCGEIVNFDFFDLKLDTNTRFFC
jgi:hypothetical protein